MEVGSREVVCGYGSRDSLSARQDAGAGGQGAVKMRGRGGS